MDIEKTNSGGVWVKQGNRARYYTAKQWEEINKEGYKPPTQIWRSYFDHNFGEVIDSPIKLREIEKTKKGAYYSVDEFRKFNEQKLNNYQNKKIEETKQSIMSGIRDIKQGRSFVKELREQAEKYR